MVENNGIVFAGEAKTPIQVSTVSVLPNYKLLLKFNTNEEKIFDFKELLNDPCYLPLKDESILKQHT